MISITVDKEEAIVTLEVEEPVRDQDIDTAVRIIDPFIEVRGTLTGVMVHADTISTWKDFVAALERLKLVKNAHKKVKRVAFVTDTPPQQAEMRQVASRFGDAEVKHFPADARKEAKAWLLEA